MSKPIKLADVIKELMAIFTKRRQIEARVKEGNETVADRIELETLNARLRNEA